MTGAPPVLALPGMTPRLAEHLTDGMERVDALLHSTVDHDDEFIYQPGTLGVREYRDHRPDRQKDDREGQ